MRILILNWRDIKNPTSGGAEVLTHEMAKRWVKLGHSVIQFSSKFPGSKTEEKIDGVKFVREGKADIRYLFNSVHFAAFNYYNKYLKGNVDVVVDEIHGIPFFTPFYVKEKKVALICEVAGRIWDTNFPFPFNMIGKFMERNYFRFYKDINFITISNSTKEELLRSGVENKRISVLPMGFTRPTKLPNFNKEQRPTLIFLARLLKAKGIEDAIKACQIIKKDFPSLSLWVIGRGEKSYEKKLKDMVKNLRFERNIKFLGFVDQDKKFELIQKAHLLLVPSLKEGFGLTVPEAGLVGTPTVAYNVEGLKDIIKDGENGFLVSPNFREMAQTVKRILSDKILYLNSQKAVISFASRLSWDKTATKALSILEL